MMGIAYGVLFTIIGLLLLHPEIGLANTVRLSYTILCYLVLYHITYFRFTNNINMSIGSVTVSLSRMGVILRYRKLRVDGGAVLLGPRQQLRRYRIR